ncbi:DUF6212 domain-containing protein [Kordiimonas marina]|uniref:DUF6212 domain-containing protein n=1 Tax=Kordiimonas marina TaxID=2872312 RepID=UPI001FF6DD95|nr:DUF6212 domain-containing protein [Kordiimonas marina]MCJ9430772.1 hypothetical protein [Kordiimonas marina]
MTQLKLTHAAYKALYGGCRVVITDETLLPHIEPLVGDVFTLLTSDGSGAIRAVGDADAVADLPALGAPLGLTSFILPESHSPVVREWGAELLLAKSKQPFDILLIQEGEEDPAGRVNAFFHGLQNRLLMDLTTRSSALERQTLYLRQASERLMLDLSAAKRMIDGIGYSDLTVVAEAPLGNGAIGPGTRKGTDSFSQLLPADGLGLSAIGLYVVPSTAPRANGTMRLGVYRDADGKLLGEHVLNYASMGEGWILVRFEGAVSNVFGDVRLTVNWYSSEENPKGSKPPQLGLSDIRGDRFGDDETGQSLALRIFKQVGQPNLSADNLKLVPETPGLPLVFLPGQHVSSLDFYGGRARLEAVTRDIGFGPYEHDAAAGWVQAHLASDAITGVMYLGSIPQDTDAITMTVSVPERSGPEVAFHAFLSGSLDDLEGRVGAVLAGAKPVAQGFDHAYCIVAAGTEKTFTLTPGHVQGTDRVLVLVAKTLTGQYAQGWCRWSKAIFTVKPGANAGRVLPEAVPAVTAHAPKKVIRTIKLPELGGMVHFIDGAERLSELSAAHGFCPMIMDDSGGYLQTHPLNETLSGAVLPSLVAPGTHEIVASAHTGHPDAPDFIYAAVLVRHDITDIAGVVQSAIQNLTLEKAETKSGGSKPGGIYWQALRLAAGQEGRLALSFDEPLDAVYHLVLVTRPVDELISFGWCRWTTVGIVGYEQTPQT